MNSTAKKQMGFTLIEMLLVLVIISMVIVLGVRYMEQKTTATRLDRTAAQMQQILNAALSYYVTNGTWPDPTGTPIACLQNSGATGCTTQYLPSSLMSPFGSAYTGYGSVSNFYVYVAITTSSAASASSYASILAGKLPLAYIADALNANPPSAIAQCTSTTCYVVASVNVPGQNLNNATAANYAGLYHNGACVPVPECPVDKEGQTMTPEIIVVPASVSGVNDAPTTAAGGTCSATDLSGCQANVYPLSSFTAYATTGASNTLDNQPLSCSAGSAGTAQDCYTDSTGSTTVPADKKYWRVCLAAITEKGQVNPTSNPWGQLQGSIMAITRCAIQNEPAGSGFTVWSQ